MDAERERQTCRGKRKAAGYPELERVVDITFGVLSTRFRCLLSDI